MARRTWMLIFTILIPPELITITFLAIREYFNESHYDPYFNYFKKNWLDK